MAFARIILLLSLTVTFLLCPRCACLSKSNPTVTYGSATIAFSNNVDTLMSSLNLYASNISYHNGSVGDGGPDTAYGSYTCTGDASRSDCKSCVRDATDDMFPSFRRNESLDFVDGYVWRDHCMLRFSKENFTHGQISSTYCKEVKMGEAENAQINRLMFGLADDAATRSSRFASGRNTSFYGEVQCSGDLSLEDCNSCLTGALSALNTSCIGMFSLGLLGSSWTGYCAVNVDYYSSGAIVLTAPWTGIWALILVRLTLWFG